MYGMCSAPLDNDWLSIIDAEKTRLINRTLERRRRQEEPGLQLSKLAMAHLT